jgi:hypothetical protein
MRDAAAEADELAVERTPCVFGETLDSKERQRQRKTP